MDFSKYDAVYVDDTATYNTGLTAMYGMRVPPKDAIKNTKNMDEDDMVYKNIHIGIPEKVEKGAVYIIRDINANSSYYTNSYEQMDLYKQLVQNNKVKEELENIGCKYELKDNYYIFYN